MFYFKEAECQRAFVICTSKWIKQSFKFGLISINRNSILRKLLLGYLLT